MPNHNVIERIKEVVANEIEHESLCIFIIIQRSDIPHLSHGYYVHYRPTYDPDEGVPPVVVVVIDQGNDHPCWSFNECRPGF